MQWFGPGTLDALRSLGDFGTANEVIERVAKDANLSDERLNEELPSGELRFRNQVQWARYYLAQEGFIDRSQRGVWSLSERGRKTHLNADQAREVFLKWVRIFQERRRGRAEPGGEFAEIITPPGDDLTVDYKARLLTIIQGLSASGSRGCHNGFCARLGSHRSKSPAAMAMAGSMDRELCSSYSLSYL